MKILFLDQSGKLGGAEMSLLDVATPYREDCLVGVFADGPFRRALVDRQIPVQIFGQTIAVQKDSGIWQSLSSIGQLLPLIFQVAQVSRSYDLIYTNTQKALVVGALAAAMNQRPLVYHLRDILSVEHFSRTNIRVAIALANRFANLVICNSEATRNAFIQAGGRSDLAQVVYNGFQPETYQSSSTHREFLRQQLGLEQKFVVGHFSRLSPWKGQHILIEAMQSCPDNVVALLVGDALFGEDDYVQQLQAQIQASGLAQRVQFLGFRSDVPQLMSVCDLVAHTSTAPEPFGRVIVEAMLCGCPVVAAAAGGAMELIEAGQTGWLSPPGDAEKLAVMINHCYEQPILAAKIAAQAQQQAIERFHVDTMTQQIQALLKMVV